MPGFLRHFESCNRHDLSGFTPFSIAGQSVGWIRRAIAARLAAETDLFRQDGAALALAPHLADFQARTDALAAAASWIADNFYPGSKMRGELYPVVVNFGDTPLAALDRKAVPWFGTRAYGIHVNGFMRRADGIYLWIGERAKDRQVAPGKLDNLIGGGLPIGLSLAENLRKEAQEEAGIGAAVADKSVARGKISYLREQEDGLRNDTLFIYDLELPEDFKPVNRDGEVARFHLWPAADVMEIVRMTDKFKFNVNLVIIDFLVRHGVMTKENEEFEGILGYLK